MEQLSFFGSGELPATTEDFGVVMLAHGQGQLLFGDSDTTRGRRKRPQPQSARLSLVLPASWQITEYSQLAQEAGFQVEVLEHAESSSVARITNPALLPVVQAWTKGAVKTVPAGWSLTPRALRLWATIAGQWDEAGLQLRLDTHIAEQEALVKQVQSALRELGAASSFVGPRAGGPALRVTGRRRLQMVLSMVGAPPDGAPWVV